MKGLCWARVVHLNNHDNNGLNGDMHTNNNSRFVGIDQLLWDFIFQRCDLVDLFSQMCTYDNLFFAYLRARKGKSTRQYVLDFEKNLNQSLMQLQQELITQIYKPKPLETFILRDPKTRKISKSDFRDRVVHHALCAIIEPLFDKRFIYDSYANRIGKGTLKAIERFDEFKRKVSKNNTRTCYVLKADVKHYFDTVDHKILINMISKKVNDENIIWLIQCILDNHKTNDKCIGMPLGNLTSQFFANIYLNELDQFVKHQLKAEYYLRYVDDFVILHHEKSLLNIYKQKIDEFLKNTLRLELHPDKSKIINLHHGISFLGFRIFYHHKIIRKKNRRKLESALDIMKKEYKQNMIDREKIVERFEGWINYLSHANTFKYRRHLLRLFNQNFPLNAPPCTQNTTTTRGIQSAKKHENFITKLETNNSPFSRQKTLQLYKKGLKINEIAKRRIIKESTVWEHLIKSIEYNQLSVWKILPKEKIQKIQEKIYSAEDKLKDIKTRIKDNTITYNEIACVLAHFKSKTRTKNIIHHLNGYKKNHCKRKCYFNPEQRKQCEQKFNQLLTQNPALAMQRKEFLDFFNNQLIICILPEKEKRAYLSWKEFRNNIKKS